MKWQGPCNFQFGFVMVHTGYTDNAQCCLDDIMSPGNRPLNRPLLCLQYY
jgi:hypothetical protein